MFIRVLLYPYAGGIQNNDSPMRIADNCDGERLVGCIDEV